MRVLALALMAFLAATRTVAGQGLTPAPAVDPAAAEAAVFAAAEPARSLKAGKILHAARISGSAPVIDGLLTDEIWGPAEAATGFVQRDPDNGRAMSQDTRIQVAYDDRF